MFKLIGLRENSKLLTIAIPTYNRAEFLDLCLSKICNQVTNYEDLVDIVVSNNCSTDNTNEIVNKYLQAGYNINYLQNDKNYGPDINILNCFNAANSKYVWLFGDDEFLLEGGLSKVIEVLVSGDYGIVYLSNIPFKEKFILEPEDYLRESKGYDVYYSKKAFIKRVNYFFTFITGNVVNKSMVNLEMEIKHFLGKRLFPTVLMFSALSGSAQNVYVSAPVFASKVDNSGGYGLCKVFGENFTKILQNDYGKGLNNNYLKIIRMRLVLNFFPFLILKVRMGTASDYQKEDYYEILYPIFKRHLYFWLFTYPVIKLPVKLMVIPCRAASVITRLIHLENFVEKYFLSALCKIKKCKFKTLCLLPVRMV